MPTRSTVPATCAGCGSAYMAREYERRMGRGKYCSRRCASRAGGHRLALMPKSIPHATPAEKIRAHGLINSRIKRGVVVRPDSCQECMRACKPDAHHEDYHKPDQVEFLCRSCHMKRHHKPMSAA